MQSYRLIIRQWDPGQFPPGLFQLGGDLLMLQEEGRLDSCTLVWADAKAGLWLIDDLSIDQSEHECKIRFGPLAAPCYVTLTLSQGTLQGILRPGNDGDAGMFTAEASGPPLPGSPGKEG